MAPTAGAGDRDELAALLGGPVAMALREWARLSNRLVDLPTPRWSASGYTGAVVTAILIEAPHAVGGSSSFEKQIIKVIPAGEERETGLHEEAWRRNRAFAERHLVRQTGQALEAGDGQFIMFQDIAGDLLDYRPIDKFGEDAQVVCCAAVARLVLKDWNGDRWPDHPTLSRALACDYLRHELRKSIVKIEAWATGNGLAESGAEWVGPPTADGGDRLPNPIALVRSELAARRVVVRYLYGLSHGDLHRGNILVPSREGAEPPRPDEIRIVDLAAFDPAAPLTRDLVGLSLSLAAAEFEAASGPDEAEILLRILLGGPARPVTESSGTGETLRAVQRAAGVPRPFLVEWHTQYLLSLLAGALAHSSYKNHSDTVRRWFFRVAARAAAEFLRFAEEKDLIPPEEIDESPEQVIASLVSAPADRTRAYTLRQRLMQYADAHGLSWTVHVLRHKDEVDDSAADRLRSPDVVVCLLSERSRVDFGCLREIEAAETGNIPVIHLRTDTRALSLGNLRDVVEAGDAGFADLTRRITAISLSGRAQRQIERKLAQTEAEEEAAEGPQQRRLAFYNRELRVRREDERRRSADTGIHRDEPEPPDLTAEIVTARVRLINEAPAVSDTEFRDRVIEMHGVEDAIADASTRVIVVHGEVGTGKTAFAAELRRRLAAPDPRIEVDAVVYLSADGYRPITVAAILHDLVRSLPNSADRERLTERLTDPIEWREKLTEVLAALSSVVVVVVLDAAELLLTGGDFRDRDLAALVRELAGRTGHASTLVLTVAGGPPQRIRRELPSNVRFLALNGLPFDDTIDFLIALDRTAALGLSALQGEERRDDRQRVYAMSQGRPRTLELLVGVLLQEPGSSLTHLLDELERIPVRDVDRALLDRTFAELDRTEQRVVQALAAYGRPVQPSAVDFLLRPSVKGVDSGPVLQGLHDRRIVRHDQGYYFLPPAESARVLAGMPDGELNDHRRPRPPFTRFALLRRAADYFEHHRPATVGNLLDLRAHFSEIDLRIRAWDYHRAVDIMNSIEDEYLRPWGQSDALLEWRRAVQGYVGDDADEADNRRRLVAALQQQEDIEEARRELAKARRRCSWLSARRARVTLNIQMANLDFDTGQFSHARRLYRRHMWQCRMVGGMDRDLTIARANLALCLARTGHHPRALRLFTTALESARTLPAGDRNRILPALLANNAWVLGQMDDVPAAMDLLREGCSLVSAPDSKNKLGYGLCLNGEAALLLESGAAEEAVRLARQAAELGVLTRDPHLIRQANLNLSLAYLRLDRDGEALATAEISARLDRGSRAVGANGLLGIAAFRRGDDVRAWRAFVTALQVAEGQVARERNDYVIRDAIGLAQFGLALVEPEQQATHLAKAGREFERARRITGAPGAVNRNSLLLDSFGERVDGDLVAAMTEVARGSASPFGAA